MECNHRDEIDLTYEVQISRTIKAYTMNYIIMGVCGSGKTTIGKALADELSIPFQDADDFHSDFNKEKMCRGIQLTDEDRYPWLMDIHKYLISKKGCVVTCSGLKKKYREVLVHGQSAQNNYAQQMFLIMLVGKRETIRSRLEKRTGHFMPLSLLDSQFASLELPSKEENCLIIDIDTHSSTDHVLLVIKKFLSQKIFSG